jgi:perosamine synthetase
MHTVFEPGAGPAGYVPLCVPELRGREWEYVKQCLDTNFVSSVGPFVNRFERELAARVGTARAVATSTGTAALHLALLVAGVQPGDEVIVPSLTFIAPVNAIRYIGAFPVCVDSEPRYWQIDAEAVRHFLGEECDVEVGIVRNRVTGRRVRAVIPVHLLGSPVDFDALAALVRPLGLAIIEDATESLGAEYRGRAVGRLGDAACFSFNGNKVITTGGGGMLVTDRADWADRARYLSTQAKDDPLEFVHGTIGFNYRLTNLQAALGCAQLERLDEYVGIKRDIARRYAEELAGLSGVTVMEEAPGSRSIFWMFTILIDRGTAGISSRELIARLDAERIQTRPLWQPAHLSPAHRDLPRRHCPVAERLVRDAVTLPSSVGLTTEDQLRVIAGIRRALDR